MKKTKIVFLSLLAVVAMAFTFKSFTIQKAQEPWTEKQLMQPYELAKILNDNKSQEIILYSIGPAGPVKNSIEVGPAKEKEGLDKLKNELHKLPKDAHVVIYCGCCPFKDCPNIRPAFNLLNEMKFTNHKLLNLSSNLKVDWIDKGYPMNE